MEQKAGSQLLIININSTYWSALRLIKIILLIGSIRHKIITFAYVEGWRNRKKEKYVVFSQWSRKSYAVFASLRMVVKIARLSMDICVASCYGITSSLGRALRENNAEDDDGQEFCEHIIQPNLQVLAVCSNVPEYRQLHSVSVLVQTQYLNQRSPFVIARAVVNGLFL